MLLHALNNYLVHNISSVSLVIDAWSIWGTLVAKVFLLVRLGLVLSHNITEVYKSNTCPTIGREREKNPFVTGRLRLA